MTRVAVQAEAKGDLAVISRYLRRHAGQSVADDYRHDFKAAFRLLATHPQIGALRPILGHGVRLVVVDPYVVLHRYDFSTDTVFVLRVLHGRRQLSLDAP